MDEEMPHGDVAPQGPRFSLANLMELVTACAVAASLSWMIGPVASFVLMLAAFGVVFKRGWIVLVAMVVLCGLAGAHFIGHTQRGDYLPIVLSLFFIGGFAWYRVIVRRRKLRRHAIASQETKKGHSP